MRDAAARSLTCLNDAGPALAHRGCMWTYCPDLLGTPVPRYTSYPTAADFGAIDPALYPQAIRSAEGEISLYVHIPFCEKICFYCGCNTAAAGKRQRLESYLAALHREIEVVGGLLQQGTTVARIAFGGGSPNAIAPVDFVRLVDALTIAFRLNDPIMSIELDPRTMTADWGAVLKAIGVRRASLGVQTFAARCQQAIGRIQDEDTIVRTVDWLREAGVTSLNFDLMYGLPDQNRDDLFDSLQRTRVLGADRIALFGYAHVPHVVPRQRAISSDALPGQAERFAMAELGHTYLATHGYTPVGFDHFARPGGDPLAAAALGGKLRRNFQGFTDDPSETLIGLGASAISSFPDLLVQTEKNPGRYRMSLSQGRLAAARGIRRNAEDKTRGRIIESLLCQGEAHIPRDLALRLEGVLLPFIERDLVLLDGDQLAITPEGLPYARTIAAIFDGYRATSETKFSSTV